MAVYSLEHFKIADALFPGNPTGWPFCHPAKAESIENEDFILCKCALLLRMTDSKHVPHRRQLLDAIRYELGEFVFVGEVHNLIKRHGARDIGHERLAPHTAS